MSGHVWECLGSARTGLSVWCEAWRRESETNTERAVMCCMNVCVSVVYCIVCLFFFLLFDSCFYYGCIQ